MAVEDWFTEAYDQSFVQHRAQQTGRRLAGTVTNAGHFTGDAVYFPRIGKVETVKARRFERLPLLNANQDMIKVSAEPEFAQLGVWDPDKNKLNVSIANEYGKVTAKAVSRAQDRQVIGALESAALVGIGNTKDEFEQIVTIGDYNTVADLDTIMDAIGILGEAEYWEGEHVTVVMPWKIKVNTSYDPYMAKSDVKGNQPWNELDWRSSQMLPKTANGLGVDMFVYAESAIIEASNDDETTISEREGTALTDIIGKWFQSGCIGRAPEGIVRIKTSIDFRIARRPIPVIDMGA